MTEPKTIVLFRADRRKNPEITAVFPEIPGTVGCDDMTCFAHVGQHSACSFLWYRTTRPATPDEYKCLKRELESAPYHYRLKVARRISRAMHDNRRREG